MWLFALKKRIESNLRHRYNNTSKKKKYIVCAPNPNDNEGRFFRISEKKTKEEARGGGGDSVDLSVNVFLEIF